MKEGKEAWTQAPLTDTDVDEGGEAGGAQY